MVPQIMTALEVVQKMMLFLTTVISVDLLHWMTMPILCSMSLIIVNWKIQGMNRHLEHHQRILKREGKLRIVMDFDDNE